MSQLKPTASAVSDVSTTLVGSSGVPAASSAGSVGLSTTAVPTRTYAIVCGGATASTYTQPAMAAAAAWNPYSMWGPPPPWYAATFPHIGQQAASSTVGGAVGSLES